MITAQVPCPTAKDAIKLWELISPKGFDMSLQGQTTEESSEVVTHLFKNDCIEYVKARVTRKRKGK